MHRKQRSNGNYFPERYISPPNFTHLMCKAKDSPMRIGPRKIEDVQTFLSLWQSRLAFTLLPSDTLMLRNGTEPRTPLHCVNGIEGPISDPF